MGNPLVLFARLYRAALLGYLLNGGEDKLARAHNLGREAIENGANLLDILRAHHRAVNAILEFAPDPRRSLERMKAAQDFLMEALSAFDMVCRSYVAIVSDGNNGRVTIAREARRRAARLARKAKVRPFPPASRDITR
jgi:hypothetical protein